MHYEIDVPLEQLITPLKLKHKIDRYVRYVNIVNVVLFTKNRIVSVTNNIVKKSMNNSEL